MIKNFQDIIHGFQTSSSLSQEVLLDLLSDFIGLSSQKIIQDNPETRIIQRILGEESHIFLPAFTEIINNFPEHTLQIFPIQKLRIKYSENIQKLQEEISIQEIEYLRKTWLEILIEKNLIKEINENNLDLSIQLTNKQINTMQANYQIIEQRILDFYKELNQNIPTSPIFFIAYEPSTIINLLEFLQKPQIHFAHFDKQTHILYINDIPITFKKDTIITCMLIEFFKNPTKNIDYWNTMQIYYDRNISEKIANQKGSTCITKINQKIYEKTKIQDFFSRGKGYFYRNKGT